MTLILTFTSSLGGQNFPTLGQWTTTFSDLGTFSSPRLSDLNSDGVLDIVLGAGREEFTACDTAVIALDGSSGELLWYVSARDQIFGTALLYEITGDGVDDIFIGGRSAELMAIDGATGKVIWRFLEDHDIAEIRALKFYNFYNPQVIDDVTGDGVADLLVANGGDVVAEAHDPNRPPGYLLIIDAVSGRVVRQVEMPDGKEIYMSAIAADIRGNGQLEIIYGTGGETTGGGLYRTSLASLLEGDLESSVLLATGASKGFIAPPAVADIDRDGILDIVCNAVDGRILAFSGNDNTPLWGGSIPQCEGYSSLAIADINGDGFLDVFTSLAQGVWPDLEATRPVLINGQDGQLIFIDSIGFYQMSSPVIADINRDGTPDGVLSLNFFMPNAEGVKTIHNSLLTYDFRNRGKFAISPPQVGSNVGSTPWIGDMDGDGRMDIVYVQMITPDRVYTYDGFRVMRIEFGQVGSDIRWGGYMGSYGTGIYKHP